MRDHSHARVFTYFDFLMKREEKRDCSPSDNACTRVVRRRYCNLIEIGVVNAKIGSDLSSCRIDYSVFGD